VPDFVATVTAAGVRRRTLAVSKASSGFGLGEVANVFGLPDKEEANGAAVLSA
jgi:hypothetical protein